MVLLVTAQVLGPGGRGAVATVLGWSRLGVAFFGLSLHQVAARRLVDERARLPAVMRALAALSAASLLMIAGAVALARHLWTGRALQSVPTALLLMGFLFAAFLIWEQYASHVLSVIGRLSSFNRGLVLGRTLGTLVAFIGLFLLGWGVAAPIAGAIVATATSTFLFVTVAWSEMRRGPRMPWRGEFWSLLKGAARLHMNTIGAFMLLQLDVVMLSVLRPLAEVGWYQASSELVSGMVLVPAAISFVFYSRIAEMGPEEAWPGQRRTTAEVLLLMIVGAVVAFAACPFLIPLLLGEEFRQSVIVFRILLVALLGMSLAQLLSSQWITRGLFVQASALTLGMGIVNVVLNALLIPKYGMYAAAWTTAGAFSLGAIVHGLFAYWMTHHDIAPECP